MAVTRMKTQKCELCKGFGTGNYRGICTRCGGYGTIPLAVPNGKESTKEEKGRERT